MGRHGAPLRHARQKIIRRRLHLQTPMSLQEIMDQITSQRRRSSLPETPSSKVLIVQHHPNLKRPASHLHHKPDLQPPRHLPINAERSTSDLQCIRLGVGVRAGAEQHRSGSAVPYKGCGEDLLGTGGAYGVPVAQDDLCGEVGVLGGPLPEDRADHPGEIERSACAYPANRHRYQDSPIWVAAEFNEQADPAAGDAPSTQ